jgi:hypothetical protein
MPRGIPKAGQRMTQKRLAAQTAVPATVETYDQAEARILEAFEVLDEMGQMAIDGDCRSLIVSGPPGLGKSYNIMKALEDSCIDYTVTKGYCKATGLYRLLWKNRHPGSVAVFDDCDTVLFDETSLNFLKAACDTSPIRTISYGAEFDMYDEEGGENIPRSFDFQGSIIFISNLDFDAEVDRGSKLAPHLGAMISRSHYIDLGLRDKRDYIIRIKHAIADGCLTERGLDLQMQQDVINFIEENQDNLRELSIRIALKIADLRVGKKTESKWKRISAATCCRRAR